ncbi:uncharacterized protein LOC128550771 [Mercenaria mercenaria]|uniref:uncharacterized protein LOC128550771 n=1 Tax=Mercenaria mercenaria TaxID=6596 RepID=UPI00234F2D99|nr:uncharacterized protein LOC128550771 [Mercenaria mercenaria]
MERTIETHTVVVHIWRPDKDHIGHSALELSDGTYISWWPETECDANHPRVKAAPNTSLSQDIEEEGKRHPISYTIQVSCEELNAIKRWWAGFKCKADYQFVSNNCSTVAFYAQEAAFPFLTALNGAVPVWVPQAVEMVAQDLAAGKRSMDKKRINEIKQAAKDEVKRIAGAHGYGAKKVNRLKIGIQGRR